MTPKQKVQRQTILTLAHRSYEKGLNLHAFFKTNDHAIGEDLVQDTFVKTWKYLIKGGRIEMMRAFLYHVLNNLIVDEYRKRKNRTTSLDVLVEKGFEPGAEDSDRPSILDGKKAILLIQHLPKIYQKIMRMKYVQNLSLHEMSILTGQSKNTIAVQAHRGLEKLKILYNSN